MPEVGLFALSVLLVMVVLLILLTVDYEVIWDIIKFSAFIYIIYVLSTKVIIINGN